MGTEDYQGMIYEINNLLVLWIGLCIPTKLRLVSFLFFFFSGKGVPPHISTFHTHSTEVIVVFPSLSGVRPARLFLVGIQTHSLTPSSSSTRTETPNL